MAAERKSSVPVKSGLIPKASSINAHGGGLLHHEGVYYWAWRAAARRDRHAECLDRHQLLPFARFIRLEIEGTALPVDRDDPASPLTPGCKMERPKVITIPRPGGFNVVAPRSERMGHSGALAGVAISDAPAGSVPSFVGAFQPNDNVPGLHASRTTTGPPMPCLLPMTTSTLSSAR